jgi:hypothetical protein
MATLSKQVLGRISGSVGDITFRQKNGTNFVSARPNSFTPATDEDSVKRREKFAFVCKLSASIISIATLKAIWEAGISNGQSAYNKIVGTNYRFVGSDALTDQTFLTPGIGFNVQTTTLTIGANNVQVIIEALGSNAGIDVSIEKNVQLVSIASLSSPFDGTVETFSLLPLLSPIQPLALDAAMTFALPFSSQTQQLFGKYQVHKLLLALITLDANGNAVNYSTTFHG